MILAKFYQKLLPKCKIWISQAQRTVSFYTSPALNLYQKYSPNCTISVSKIQNFPASEGERPTSDTPVSASAIGADTLPNHQKKNVKDEYAPGFLHTINTGGSKLSKWNMSIDRPGFS